MSAPKKAPKKVVKKTTAKKEVKKTTSKPKSTPKKLKKPPVAKKEVKKTKKNPAKILTKENETVTLPTDAGIRIKEKVKVAKSLHGSSFSKGMYVTAYVFSVCFLLVGIATIFSSFYSIDSKSFSAVTCIASGDCLTNVSIPDPATQTGPNVDSVANTQVVNLSTEPEFNMLDVIPGLVTEDIKLNFNVKNGINIAANLLSESSGGLVPLELVKISSENYRILIPGSSLPDARYSIKVFVTKTDETGTYSYPGGSFIVRNSVDTPVDSRVPTASSTSADSEQVVIDDEVDFVQTAPIDVITPFTISSSNEVFTNREAVRVTAPDSYSNIELYIRAERALEARFLGTMSKEFDRWLYSFDSNNIPNGNYELYAQAKNATEIVTSPSRTITIKNTLIEAEVTRIEKAESVAVQEPNRNFYLYEDSASSSDRLEITAENETKKLVNENAEMINDLLVRYAVAIQSGNTTIVDGVTREIDEERQRIITTVILDPVTTGISSQIDTEFQNKITELTNKVQTFETIRSSRSGDISNDSDSDGVSDFDEKNVYGTDPNNPDSDNDGFIDGAEIIGGFDPTSEAPETFVSYELPKEVVGLERSDVLRVEKVTPLVTINAEDEAPIVKAQIQGKGLPDSFATIYVFSTPVIVTVKTDADGSFVYTFDKELENGEHEVFVAFTDNTGAILAHSKPFTFVKEAQAFSPVDATETSVVSAVPITETAAEEAYRVVFGLIVLVLGIILLMLGVNIRSQRDHEKQMLA